jgi:sugar phosphate isomerase/epimerase
MVKPAPRPMALQLWTVREDLEADAAATLQRVAARGFTAVETYGLGAGDVAPAERVARAAATRRLLDNAGLVACAAHGRLPGGAELDAVLDELRELGADCLVVPSPGSVDGCGSAFSDADGVRALAERLNAAAERAAARGVTIGYHNHWQEWGTVGDGRTGYDLLWERLDPGVVAEVDVYWARVGGQDPAAVIAGLGERCRFLHVKDGPADTVRPQTPLGEGVLDLDAALAAGPHARWHVVELDECDTDRLDAARAGGDWLVARGWSRWAA